MRSKKTVWLLLLLAFAVELVFLPMPGIQEDEMLFAVPFLNGRPPLYHWGAIPVMLMDYIGALKTWIYWPLLKLFPLNIWTVRLPVCFLSLVTLWLFANLTRRVAGDRAAILATAILATDVPFLLTNTFDWGPVCLLLLASVAFVNLLNRFSATGGTALLGAAFLIAGLATWYKPLFLVLMVAMGCAWLIVLRPKRWSRIALLAIPAFATGAIPLVAFNLQNHLATAAASRYLPDVPATEKLLVLRRVLEGRALEHYMFRSMPGEEIQLTGASAGALAENWFGHTNLHPGSLLFPALMIALLLLPFLRNSPFFTCLCMAWIGGTIAFALMLIYRGAGAGPHHAVLLDPAPQFIVAVTAVAAGKQFGAEIGATCVVILVALSNLLLIGQYMEAGVRNGFSVFWTEGVAELAHDIETTRMPVAFLDWGIENGARTMSGNRIEVVDPGPVRPGVLYVGHCEGYVIDPSRSVKYLGDLNRMGLVPDRRGNPVFCTYQQ